MSTTSSSTTSSSTTSSTTTTSTTVAATPASRVTVGSKTYWDPGHITGIDMPSLTTLCGANVTWGYFIDAIKKWCDRTGHYSKTLGFHIGTMFKNTGIPLWNRATDPWFVQTTGELICEELVRYVVILFIDFIII